jgi:hypothetical protein
MSTNFEAPALAEQLNQPASVVEISRLHEIVDTGKRIIGRTALVLGLATGLVTAEAAVLDPRPAAAETGGYPDAEAPCVANNNGVTDGTGYWCSGYQWGYYARNAAGQITGNTQTLCASSHPDKKPASAGLLLTTRTANGTLVL